MREEAANSGKTNRRAVASRAAVRSSRTLLTLCAVISAGCGGVGFLGLQDYQRDLLFGVGSLALSLLNPPTQGPAGPPGEPGLTPPAGISGTPCWDVNGNTFGDPQEDINGDNAFNVLDCQGAAGEPGPVGPPGDDRPVGDDGQNGVDCWDLNGNGVNNASEDINADGQFNALDCQGSQGPPGTGGGGGGGQPGSPGSNGFDCWDLNRDRVGNPNEDVNSDGLIDVQDCQGSPGELAPTFFDTFIDDFFTVDGGAYDALELNPGDNLPVVEIREPALGANCSQAGVGVLAYRVGISQRYNTGNPVTMRLFLWRTGPQTPNCFVFRLDAFRARHGTTIGGYDSGDGNNTRFVRPVLPALIIAEGMSLVVDLPLNNTGGGGLGFANNLGVKDLLAFELSTLPNFQDGGCYTLLAVNFFETQGQGSESLANAAVFTDVDDIDCDGQCVVDADCPDLDAEFCNGGRMCVNGVCEPGPPPCGDDGIACTTDSCDEALNVCVHLPNNGLCDNFVFCDGQEVCHPTNGCQDAPDVICDDGVACTKDECNQISDSCDFIPDDANCDDGEFCNGPETCDPLDGCRPGPNPCPGQLCDEDDDVCVDCFVDADCDDPEMCTVCQDNVCVPLPPMTSCSDIEIVFIMDTSPSMEDEAEGLCDNIPLIIAAIQTALPQQDPPVQVDVFTTVWGITEDGNPNDGDGDGDPADGDMDGNPDYDCLLSDVLDELGGVVPGNNGACPGNLIDDVPGQEGYSKTSESENWASATAIAAVNFGWQPGTVRLIIPISDEGPCMGGQDVVNACRDSDQDATDNAGLVASGNGVIVSPIIGTPFEGQPSCIMQFAQQIADQTGGMAFQTTDPNSADDLVQAIVAAAVNACVTSCPDRGPARLASQAETILFIDGPIAVPTGIAGDEGPDE